jgi:hypothetical protein
MSDNYMTHKYKYISGPENVVRLEGQIENINKILYVFFDTHRTVERQNKCEDVRAKNIVEYFADNFDKTNKTCDFFLEINPTRLNDISLSKYHDKYIREIMELFKTSHKEKIFPNIRFHYMDIRHYLNYNIHPIEDNILSLIDLVYRDRFITVGDANAFIDYYYMLIGNVKVIYDMLYYNAESNKKTKPVIPETVEILSKYTPKEINEISGHLVNKILKGHKYDKVKTVINNYINTTLKEAFDIFFNRANNIIEYFKNIIPAIAAAGKLKFPKEKDKLTNIDYLIQVHSSSGKLFMDIICNTYDEIYDMNEYGTSLFAQVVDMFFLRRFLNKDYITNAAIYTGGAHSIMYIYMLVKYFGFKITHASYALESIDKINGIIKNLKQPYHVAEYLWNPESTQCSDVSKFPPLFE